MYLNVYLYKLYSWIKISNAFLCFSYVNIVIKKSHWLNVVSNFTPLTRIQSHNIRQKVGKSYQIRVKKSS